jgi:1-acyl-sn-glycerol-3-phosphate acyltransferase
MAGDHAQIPGPNPHLLRFVLQGRGRHALALVTRYFHAKLHGAHHVPAGGALLVSNHALFALDSVVLGALLVQELGRNPRFLVDRNVFDVAGLRQAVAAVGGLVGEPGTAETLLRAGELVLVYPGGVDDSLKLSRERYQLKWKRRSGFARVALRAGVPIVPVAGLGIDDMYTVVAREPWLGRRLFGNERYDLPLAIGAYGTLLPRRVHVTYEVAPPIAPLGSPDSEADVEAMRAATYDALDSRLRGLRARGAAR